MHQTLKSLYRVHGMELVLEIFSKQVFFVILYRPTKPRQVAKVPGVWRLLEPMQQRGTDFKRFSIWIFHFDSFCHEISLK